MRRQMARMRSHSTGQNFNPLYEALVFAAIAYYAFNNVKVPKFQSSIRGLSFCGEAVQRGILFRRGYFNPLYEALVFAAMTKMYLLVHGEKNFNPLYEALVFAAPFDCILMGRGKTFQSSIRGFSFCGEQYGKNL